jgi:hypothetical protein
MSTDELRVLFVREDAAVALVRQGAIEPWQALELVIAPSVALREASEAAMLAEVEHEERLAA